MKKDNLAMLFEPEEERTVLTADLLFLVNEPSKKEIASAEEEVDLEPTEKEIEALDQKSANIHITDPFLLYLRDLSKYPALSKEEERELFRFGKLGREKILLHSLRLVVKVARKYAKDDMRFLDLIQEGNMGLLHAMEKFDHEKGFRFSTYAVWWIRQACAIASVNKSRNIRIPYNVVGKIKTMEKTAAKLKQELGRNASDDEIAEKMEVETKVVSGLKKTKDQIKTISFSVPVGEDEDSQLGDFIESHEESPEFEIIERDILDSMIRTLGCNGKIVFEVIRRQKYFNGKKKCKPKKSLQKVLSEMKISQLTHSERNFYVLILRRMGFSLKEIGEQFKTTRERIRQIEAKALKKISWIGRRNW